MYRYYLPYRPPMPGAIPRGAKTVVAFDDRTRIHGTLEAWGYAEYDEPLDDDDVSNYELVADRHLVVDEHRGEESSW